MMAKQEKFKKEFERLDFKFETKHLVIPPGKKQNEEYLASTNESNDKDE